MNNLKRTLMLLGSIAALGLANMTLMAQDEAGPNGRGPEIRPRGSFNRLAMMGRLREKLEVRDDSQWAVISEKIGSVLDARRAAMDRAGGPPPRPGPALGPEGPEGPGGFRDVGFGPQTRADAALHGAVNHNSPDAALKAVLSEVRALHKNRDEAYAKAQDDLRALLDIRQEAQLTLAGILR